ncbi:MAG: response regulator, partial [Pseudomonadota bacterium]|nr:response regulator [Pseudomonadota bacterium]
VRDSGVGFPAESSYQMVRAFQRGRNATGIDGVGLGLSIVVELLKQMGSELRIDSGPEGGSVFYFEVTLEEASEEEVDFVFRENHTSGVQGDGCSILLVDDVELTRVFLSELLLGYGFDVTAVASAEQALVELEQGWVDLLISDQLMPGVDGWELLRMVRSRFPDLPALLYSSTPPSPQPSQRDLAFDAALLKPASTDALLEHIQRLCRCCMGQGKVSSITDPAGSDC